MKENLTLKKVALHNCEKFLTIELHSRFRSALKNLDLLWAKVSRLQIWTLGMVDTQTNRCQHMLEEQPLCQADQGPGAKRQSSCCLRKRSLAAGLKPPVSDQHRRDGARGTPSRAQSRTWQEARIASGWREPGERPPRASIHSSPSLCDTAHAAASGTAVAGSLCHCTLNWRRAVKDKTFGKRRNSAFY